MFFVVGFRERLEPDGGERLGYCPAFGGDAGQVHAARRGALTFFAVPVVPYRKRPAWICDACQRATGADGTRRGHRPRQLVGRVSTRLRLTPVRPWSVDRNHWPTEEAFDSNAPYDQAAVKALWDRGAAIMSRVGGWAVAPVEALRDEQAQVRLVGEALERLGAVPWQDGRITDPRARVDGLVFDLDGALTRELNKRKDSAN